MSTNAETKLEAPPKVDIENREEFQAAATEVIDALKGASGTLVLDLAATEFVDTAGLGAIATVHQMALEAGLEVSLLNANAEVIGALELARLDDLFERQLPDS